MRRHVLRTAVADRRGSAAVEFALGAIVLFMLLCGALDFGRMFWIRNTLQYAAEEAGRYALANPTATDDVLKQQASASIYGIDPATVDVSVGRDTSNGVNFVTITAQYSFKYLTTFIYSQTFTLTGQATVPLSA